MRNFTSLKARINSIFLVLFFALLSFNVFAEGTPQVSPNPTTSVTALVTSNETGSLISGSYFNCPDDNRVKFTINSTSESFYFGFDWYTYVAASPIRLTNLYWRIRTVNAIPGFAAGAVVASGRWDETGASGGRITTFAQASAGPNISGSVPAGYSPLTFNPTSSGEYWIEYFRGTDASTPIAAGTRSIAPLFDFTVADNSGSFTKHPGRVNSGKWGMVAVTPTTSADPYTIIYSATAEPVFYAYTTDQVNVKIDFESGFKPIAFDVAVNSYGVSTGSTWDVTRKSIDSPTAPTLTGGYKVFLNIPDVSLYPLSATPIAPTFLTPSVTGCGPFLFHYNVTSSGDVQLLLDLNGTLGYQAGTSDRILEAFAVSAGNNTLAWDGKDGLGNNVATGTNMNIKIKLLRGRFNLPLYDAEINTNGIRVGVDAPLYLTSATMYWDDSTLATVPAASPTCDIPGGTTQANNITTAGTNNTYVGFLSPSHAWNGNGNPTNVVPAPSVASNDVNTAQCDDFGNVRAINTWGWGAISLNTQLNIVLGCADLGVNKSVSNVSPSFGSNVTFTIVVTNAGPAPSPNTIINDLLPSGYTYVSDNSGGAYNNTTGLWAVGTLVNGGSATLQIVATVKGSGLYSNTAAAYSDQIDPVSGNNSSTATLVPVCNATVAPILIKN